MNRGGEPAKIALGLLKLTVPLEGKIEKIASYNSGPDGFIIYLFSEGQ